MVLNNVRIDCWESISEQNHHSKYKKKRKNKPSTVLETVNNTGEQGLKKKKESKIIGHEHDLEEKKHRKRKREYREAKIISENRNMDSDDLHLKERKHRERKRKHKDSKVIPNYPVQSPQVDLPVPTKICEVGKTNDGENGTKSAPIVKKKKKHRNVDVATDEQAKVSPEEKKMEGEKATKIPSSEEAKKVTRRNAPKKGHFTRVKPIFEDSKDESVGENEIPEGRVGLMGNEVKNGVWKHGYFTQCRGYGYPAQNYGYGYSTEYCGCGYPAQNWGGYPFSYSWRIPGQPSAKR